MSESVNLPALGESVTEGTVTRWLKNVGDRVEVDEPLLEVSTDKVDTEIPSPVAGVIEEILVQEDETVEVGTALVRIGDGSSAPAEEAPAGGEDDFVVIEHVGEPPDFSAEGFEPKDHIELGRILGAIDIDRGAKVSGARFYYLTGVGADLELALVQMAMDQARTAGFTTMIPPALVRPRAMEGTGFLGEHADEVYHLEEDDLYLVGTSEVPLAGYHCGEILDLSAGPLRYAGWSSCFRREAGSHGKDTRGIIRVHWFDKVEMFSYTTMEESYDEHLRLLGWEKEWLAKLELAYRVIDTAAGDLGLSAQRKFDCEAWIPTQGRYRELTSTSNCTTYQARRLDIRERDPQGSGTRTLATLNGTAITSTRPIVALLENHQQADGSVRVPEALRPFLGTDVISPR